jgi:hypothetical protein
MVHSAVIIHRRLVFEFSQTNRASVLNLKTLRGHLRGHNSTAYRSDSYFAYDRAGTLGQAHSARKLHPQATLAIIEAGKALGKARR